MDLTVFTFINLSDAFIQSDLQVKTKEAIKPKKTKQKQVSDVTSPG